MTQSVSITGDTENCAKSLVAGPGLREDVRRDTGSIAHQTSVDARHAFTLNLESHSVALVLSHSDPPPGHQPPPTVLRL
jgi:hypothetical protein